MRTLSNHQQYVDELSLNISRWVKRKSRKIRENVLQSALILLGLNLDPAREILQPLYSENPRGRKPYDPICMLRALLLMVLLRYKSLSTFASDLRSKRRLAIISGFSADNIPACSTFYLFIDRLEDGNYQKPCEHMIKPSKLRKGKHLRHLKSEKEQRNQDSQTDATVYDSVTEMLAAELLRDKDKPRSTDLTARLEDILMLCAIIPSADKGLLGDTDNLTIAGDGSALETGANGNGKPSCQCRNEGIYRCEHPRYYSDPTADWGYDSYRDCYYFGHTLYQHVVSEKGHDLPLNVIIANASETDYTLSLKSADRLRKSLAEKGLDWNIKHAVYDAGHDAVGIYQYHLAHQTTPVIALNPRSGVYPAPTGTAQKVSEEGIPLCAAGKEMRRHDYDRKKGRIYYNCPVKRPSHRNGKHCWVAYQEECPNGVLCQPDTKMSPVVYTRTKDDPRLYPPIKRGTAIFKRLYNKRTGCERSNSQKKEVYRLAQRPCRSKAHFLVRLYLISMIEHAKAWLAEKKKVTEEPYAIIEAIRD
ncbi:transposase [bacterium]|nr:transposase [bacterium]